MQWINAYWRSKESIKRDWLKSIWRNNSYSRLINSNDWKIRRGCDFQSNYKTSRKCVELKSTYLRICRQNIFILCSLHSNASHFWLDCLVFLSLLRKSRLRWQNSQILICFWFWNINTCSCMPLCSGPCCANRCYGWNWFSCLLWSINKRSLSIRKNIKNWHYSIW